LIKVGEDRRGNAPNLYLAPDKKLRHVFKFIQPGEGSLVDAPDFSAHRHSPPPIFHHTWVGTAVIQAIVRRRARFTEKLLAG